MRRSTCQLECQATVSTISTVKFQPRFANSGLNECRTRRRMSAGVWMSAAEARLVATKLNLVQQSLPPMSHQDAAANRNGFSRATHHQCLHVCVLATCGALRIRGRHWIGPVMIKFFARIDSALRGLYCPIARKASERHKPHKTKHTSN